MLLDKNNGLRDGSNERPESMSIVRIVVLGARGVGKTSIIEQFVYNQFSTHYKSTRHKRLYYPSIFINEHTYQVQIIDLPALPYFPADSISEWSNFRGFGLRSATAFLLVFDVTNEDSFRHARMLREQLIDSSVNESAQLIVVANKCDSSEGRQMARRELANTIKKQWRCTYLEVSAKHNWHIVTTFKEIMRLIDTGEVVHKPAAIRVQDALRRNSCVIL